MPAAITCSSCNRPLRVPESVLGQTVQCPLCLDEFVAQADPAAEAAARAAEPPVKRSVPKPQLVTTQVYTGSEPPPLPTIEEESVVEVEPIAEVVPTNQAARETAEQRAFVFPVFVTRDPDRILRGRMDGELTAQGLYLRKVRQAPAFAAVGARARYLGGNRLSVTVEGRDVELTIVKPRTSTHHLARDTAAFLNGKGDFPQSKAYKLPWYLYVTPAAFIALPIAGISLGLMTDGCLGAFLWCLIAVALAAATLMLVLQPWLRPRARLIGAVSLVGLGAAIFLITIPLSPAYYVDASLWRNFTSPNGDFRVQMPGLPISSPPLPPPSPEKYVVDVKSPEIQLAVFVAPAPENNPNVFQPFGNNSNYQAYNDAKNRLQQMPEYAAYNLYYPQELDVYQSGQMCHELIYSRVASRNGYSSQDSVRTLVARIVVVNGKVYTLAVLGPRVRADGSDVVKFFNSFQPTTRPVAQPLPVAPPPGQAPLDRAPTSPIGMKDLLAHWSFDKIQGDRALDDTHNQLTGVLHQAAIINDGARGKAVRFTGPGSYFDFSDASPFLNCRNLEDFTFSGWARTWTNQGTVLSARNQWDSSAKIEVLIDKGVLTAEVQNDGNEAGGPATVIGKAISDGAWHHFAVTRRGVGTIALYIDGVSQGQATSGSASGAITTNVRALGAELYLQKGGIKPLNSTFTGDVAEFCVFKRALDDGEIKKLAGVGP